MFARIVRLPRKTTPDPVSNDDASPILAAIRDAVTYIEFAPAHSRDEDGNRSTQRRGPQYRVDHR